MYAMYRDISEISYEPSKWCFDMLGLRNEEELRPGSLLTVSYQEIASASSGRGGDLPAAFDRVFAISLDVLVAVNFAARCMVTYHYANAVPHFLYDTFQGPGGERWLDVVCLASYGSKNLMAPYSFSLLVLTDKDRLMLLEVVPGSNRLLHTHDIPIHSKHHYTKILLRAPCQNEREEPMGVYLWSPQRKILQQFAIQLQGEAAAEPVPFTEFKVKNPKWNGKEVVVNGADLTLSIDEQNDSVLCADAGNHLLFECGMKLSQLEVLCGQGVPGTMEEHTPSKQAYLSAPCAPLVFRPQDFVEKGRFTPSAKNILGVASKGRPRLLLVCDPGNHGVRKIWQFPDHPQALDLAGFDEIDTLVGEFHFTGRYRPSLCRRCENPKALYVNPCGLLTVTMEDSAYVIAAYSVIPEQETISSNVSGGS